MFANVLIGVAEMESGRDAAELAKLLAAPGGRRELVHILPERQPIWRRAEEEEATAERQRALQMLADLRAAVGIEADLRCLMAKTPGRGLHELAEQTQADLLVVGSSRRGPIGRVLLGDDTSAALGGAPCAVAIAPAGFAKHPQLRLIGVGYDGSPESERALAAARELARAHHAKVAALEAVIVALPMRGGSWYLAQELIDAASARLAKLEDVEPHVQYGLPAEELARFSASVDLLVIGSRGYGPLGRLVHGSTSRQLARTASSPLLVLTRPARLEEEQAGEAEAAASERSSAQRAAVHHIG